MSAAILNLIYGVPVPVELVEDLYNYSQTHHDRHMKSFCETTGIYEDEFEMMPWPEELYTRSGPPAMYWGQKVRRLSEGHDTHLNYFDIELGPGTKAEARKVISSLPLKLRQYLEEVNRETGFPGTFLVWSYL